MNDYYSLSLLHLNQVAIEHDRKLTSWPGAVRQRQAEDNKILHPIPQKAFDVVGQIQRLSIALGGLAHRYDGQ
ncbi:MAG TPA: hypothetical protein VJ022_05675 [Anaerolineales bacterium]|nr:hypothetical protein [Anaerolineales bacterium]